MTTIIDDTYRLRELSPYFIDIEGIKLDYKNIDPKKVFIDRKLKEEKKRYIEEHEKEPSEKELTQMEKRIKSQANKLSNYQLLYGEDKIDAFDLFAEEKYKKDESKDKPKFSKYKKGSGIREAYNKLLPSQ